MRQGYKSSSINQYSEMAEREVTLSDIDSKLFNGEITTNKAREMMIQWAVDNEAVHQLPALMLCLK